MNKRADRRKRIEMALDEFRAAIGRALGVAADLHSQAAMDHAKAMVELWLRTEGIDNARRDPHFAVALANPVMSDVVERAEEDRRREFAEWTETGPDTLAGIVAASAPGVAGAPSEDWLGKVGDADGTGVLPELWRIGTAVSDSAPEPVTFPVAVPLLDTAHLQSSPPPEVAGERRGAGRGAAVAGAQLLPARPGAHPRLGHRPADRSAARPVPVDQGGPAHRARSGAAGGVARRAVRTHPQGALRSAGRRAHLGARDQRWRGTAHRAVADRGAVRQTAGRSRTSINSNYSASPATASPAACS